MQFGRKPLLPSLVKSSIEIAEQHHVKAYLVTIFCNLQIAAQFYFVRLKHTSENFALINNLLFKCGGGGGS